MSCPRGPGCYRIRLGVNEETLRSRNENLLQRKGGSTTAANRESARAVITTNKVVARFLDGRSIKGWCLSFNPDKPLLKVESADRSTSHEIKWEDLKALFFVREFEGMNKALDDFVLAQAPHVSSLGQHVQLEFLDGEVIQGYAEGLKKDKRGFFITPLDPESNNVRAFVPQSALRKLTIAPKLGETMVLEGMVHSKDIKTALRKQKEYRETKLGEVIVRVGMTSHREVERALNVQRAVGQKLGRILVQADILSEDDLNKALAVQQEHRRKRLGEILVEMGLATPESVTLALALKYRLPYVDPSLYTLDFDLEDLVGRAIARELKFIPIAKQGGEVTIAIDDPINFRPRDFIQSTLGLKVKEALATPESIQRAIDRWYKKRPSKPAYRRPGPSDRSSKGGQVEDIRSTSHGAEEESIAALLDDILRKAAEKNASDIHLNPEREKTVVSYRIEGVLYPVRTLDIQIHPLLVSRIKIMGNMSVTQRDLPQEGRTRLRIGEKLFDMGVSSLPAISGESVVIRLMEKSGPVPRLKALGFSEADLGLIRNFIGRHQGMILISGPAGSGKSTTLYSCLMEPVFERKHVILIDDKIEHEFSKATQIQLKPQIDLTYANALKQCLKHDPDVIVLGEIRDSETARLAVHAALSGHLLIATISTASASETLGYLLSMGIEPYLIASSVIAIMSQRLVRTICASPGCRQRDASALANLKAAGLSLKPFRGVTFWKGKGCRECRGGYRGRSLIYEIMRMEGPLKGALAERRPAPELQEAARSMGMQPLKDGAFQKAAEGVTTVEEVLALALPDAAGTE